jgi:hypothetical protein
MRRWDTKNEPNLKVVLTRSSNRFSAIDHRWLSFRRKLRSCELPRTRKMRKRDTYNNRHFDVQLAPEFSDAERNIRNTFPDKTGEDSTQPRIGY